MLSLLWVAIPTKIETMYNVTECSPVIAERDGAPFDSLPGPWSWGSARFDLLDAALDETAGTFTRVESEALPVIGSLVRTVHSENITFDINGNETPLVLTAGQAVSNSRYTSADIGLRISDSALVTALYLRSAEGANLLGASPSVLEIGAGVGLVGIDLSLRNLTSGRASVTLTDREPNLINAIHTNALAASADVRVGTLGWVTGDPQGIAKELRGTLDIVIGAAVCYKKEGMWALATLIQELGAPVTLIVNHPVWSTEHFLKSHLMDIEGLTIEERRLTLVSRDAEAPDAPDVQSCGVHSLLIVRQAAKGVGGNGRDEL